MRLGLDCYDLAKLLLLYDLNLDVHLHWKNLDQNASTSIHTGKQTSYPSGERRMDEQVLLYHSGPLARSTYFMVEWRPTKSPDGAALEGSDLLCLEDNKAWVDDVLDLSPLLEHEFVTQWDCYDKIYQPMNGAVMHFKQHSPYLCEAFEIMARSPPPKSGTTE
ncbi:uncharacterized protein FOMMEDRAFT_162732 [Fomitiporia mediterranea MF3/22]|uniref:Uncharacterized protein n=1 Tax=Fomitiporia mediterranea (strain MF3/22) TaxID=694068 RepID=R7SJD2_FOMME|nr:uncharacterized protein FOMMEDRAFT_162732 [Fomitiporia mediterranea MF3/22]EJC97709.1 hypothetical protein FOMMEDRAFT_162732 [Fomitiporia mediterranea MF3/22]